MRSLSLITDRGSFCWNLARTLWRSGHEHSSRVLGPRHLYGISRRALTTLQQLAAQEWATGRATWRRRRRRGYSNRPIDTRTTIRERAQCVGLRVQPQRDDRAWDDRASGRCADEKVQF